MAPPKGDGGDAQHQGPGRPEVRDAVPSTCLPRRRSAGKLPRGTTEVFSRFDSTDGTASASFGGGVRGEGSSGSLPPVLLHFDINKTVIQSDSMHMDTIDEGLREGIADLFWGRVESVGGETHWRWTGNKPSCNKPSDIHTDGSEEVLTYSAYCKQVLQNKEERKKYTRSFGLVDDDAKAEMEKLLQLTCKKMEMPSSLYRSPEAEACGLTGSVIAMFPSIFQLVAMLQRQKRVFALLFRSFGNDHGQIQKEWNAFCEMRHPIFSGLLKDIGPLDGSVSGIPDRRLKNIHTMYRDKDGPVLILDEFTNGPPDRDKSWDSWARKKPKHTSDLRNGRDYIRNVLKAEVCEGTREICRWMKDHIVSQATSAIKDDWAWWTWNGEASDAGKLMYVVDDLETKQLFFDDNIDFHDARIVDCRDATGNTLPPEMTLNWICTKVNPIEAVLDHDYFLRKLQVCHGDHLDVGNSLINVKSQLQESEEQKENLMKQLKQVQLQLKNLTEENRRMKLQHCLHVNDESGLRALLKKYNCDLDAFGKNGCRSVRELFEEIDHGHCWLEEEDNQLVRIFEMVYIKIQYKDLVLIESNEQNAKGIIQPRGYLPGVRKSLREASFTEAIDRWLHQGLQVNLKDCVVAETMPLFVLGAPAQTTHATQSYPINCRVQQSECEFFIQDKAMSLHPDILSRIGLPGGKHFNTTEPDLQGDTITRFWRWDKVATWEAVASSKRMQVAADKALTSSVDAQAIDIHQVFEKLFQGHFRREVYENLLLQMFETFTATTIAGGFSGSIVIRVQPFESDGRPGEPCIVKLDEGSAIREEFDNSVAVFDALPDRAARIIGDAVYAKSSATGEEFGAMRLELAGACWNVPELAQGSANLLSTFKDLLLYESEQVMLGRDATVGERPFGNVNSVIAETFGPGGMVSSLRKGGKGLHRAEVPLVWGWYTLKGKESKMFNPYVADSRDYPPQQPMKKQYFKYFGAEMPDLKELVVNNIKPRLQKLANSPAKSALYPLVGLAHGDLNAANIMIDALDAVWLIDFATSVDLPLFTDMCKFEMAVLFEYATIPITPKVLLDYASRNEDRWAGLGVGDWLCVKQDVAVALLRKLSELSAERLKDMTGSTLRRLIDDVVSNLPMSPHKQRQALRTLKARLTASEESMDCAFRYCECCSKELLKGDYLLDALRIGVPDVPVKDKREKAMANGGLARKSVVGWETNDEKRDGKSEPQASEGAASLRYFMDLTLTIRRFMLEDVLGCLRDFSRSDHVERDSDRFQRQSSSAGGGLELADASALQLWLPVLRESYRIIGYKDVPPHKKLWAIYHCSQVAGVVLQILDQLDPHTASLRSLPIVARVANDVESLSLTNDAEAEEDEYESFTEVPFCEADSQWLFAIASFLPHGNLLHDRIVRKAHSLCKIMKNQSGLFSPIFQVLQKQRDGNQSLQLVAEAPPGRSFKVFVQDLKDYACKRTPSEGNFANGIGGLQEDPSLGGVIGYYWPAEDGGEAKVQLRSSLVFLRRTLLKDALDDKVIPAPASSATKEFSGRDWIARVFGEESAESTKSQKERTPGRSMALPDDFATFLELDAVIQDGKGQEIGSLAIVLGHPTVCYTPSSCLCVCSDLDLANVRQQRVVVMQCSEQGGYQVCSAENLRDESLRDYEPTVNNHIFLTPVSMSVRDRILFQDEPGCWKDCDVMELGSSSSLYRTLIQPIRSGSDSMSGQRALAYLNVMNSGPSRISAAVYEEEVQKMKVYYKARNSFIIDALSGAKLDIKACAEPTLQLQDTGRPLSEGGSATPRRRSSMDEGSVRLWGSYSLRKMTTLMTSVGACEGRDDHMKGWGMIQAAIHTYSRGQACCMPKAFFVKGSPGSGKTCLVHRIIMDCVDHHLDLVPLVLPVADMVRRCHMDQVSEDDSTLSAIFFERYLRITFGEDSARYKMFRQAICMHRAVFLFEGLEDAGALAPLVEKVIRDFVFQSQFVIVTSRPPLKERKCTLEGMPGIIQVMQLQHLTDEQKRSVAHKRLGLKGLGAFDKFFQQLRKSHNEPDHTDPDTDELGEDVFGNPMMLSMLLCYLGGAAGDAKGHSASPKGEDSDDVTITAVYRVAIDVMLQRVQSKQQADRHNREGKVEQCKRILEKIAMRMHLKQTYVIGEEEIAQTLKGSGLSSSWLELKSAVVAGHAMFLRMSEEGYRFLVKGFQDYFAASDIAMESSGRLLPPLSVLLTEKSWAPTLEMLAEAWPHRYVRLIEDNLSTFQATKGDSLFHTAARVGHRPVFQHFKLLSDATQRMLYLKNAERQAPLHVASEHGFTQICALMLANSAVLDDEDNCKRMPLHTAMQNGHFQTAKFLLDRIVESGKAAGNRSEEQEHPAMQLAARILEGPVSEEEFRPYLGETFVELNFFTKDEVIEKKRAMCALLAIFWISSNQYELFVRPQKEESRLSKASWDKLQEWTQKPQTVGLTSSPAVLGAMLVLAAIFNVGKITRFRKTFAPEYDEPFEALASILQKAPVILPSYAKLDSNLQRIVLSAVKSDFNFGQFLQGENLPASLCPFKQVVGSSRDGSVNVLGFFLFRIFAAMCGILGGVTLDGSLFMNERNYRNYSLGLEVIQHLKIESAQEVYNRFLASRAEQMGMTFDFSSSESRACVRLLCLSRAFTLEEGRHVLESFQELSPQQRSDLAEYLHADGIRELGFLMYGSPQLLENAKNNRNIGLRLGFTILLRIYQKAAQEYQSVETKENKVVQIMMQEIIQHAKDCTDPEVFDFVKFSVTRSPGNKGISQGSVHLSPWQLWNSPETEVELTESGDKLVEDVLLKTVRESVFEKRLRQTFPELKYYDGHDPEIRAIERRTLGAMLVIYWVASDQQEAFSRGQDISSKMTDNSWSSIIEWVENGIVKHELLDVAFVAMTICDLGRIPKFREQLAPHCDGHKAALQYVMDTCPKVLPSYARLSPEMQKIVYECLTVDLDFAQFLYAECLPAHLTCVLERVRGKFNIHVQADIMNVFLLICFAQLSASLAAEMLEGSIFMTEVRVRRFNICAKAIKLLNEGYNEVEAYDRMLSMYAEELGMDGTAITDTSKRHSSISSNISSIAAAYAPEMSERRVRQRALVRLVCMVDTTNHTTESDEKAHQDVVREVTQAVKALSLREQRNLARFLNMDGLNERPGYLLRDCSNFLKRAWENPEVTFDAAVQILLRVYAAVAAEFGSTNFPWVEVRLERLTKFAHDFFGIADFKNVQFRLHRLSEREAEVFPEVWIPVTNQQVLDQLARLGSQLSSGVVDGSIKEEDFKGRLGRLYPELPYLSETQQDRTKGALFAVFWLLSGDYAAFVRGQAEDDQLSKRSWEWIQEWLQNAVKLTSDKPDRVDAILVFMAIHALGKIPAFREELVPGYPHYKHDEALAQILLTQPEVVPSFARLSEPYKSLIIASLSVNFRFSQFLQAENVPANLVHMKERLKPHGDDGFAFFCFRIFAQMCGRNGLHAGQGALFMTESQFNRFRPGLDALQQLHTTDATTAHNAFLLLRGMKAMSRFASPEHQALARLLCLGSAFDRESGQGLCDAFDLLPQDERSILTRWLNTDGIEQIPGHVLCDAPAFLQNAKVNPHVGYSAALQMLLKVQCACCDVEDALQPSQMVVVELRALAAWAAKAGAGEFLAVALSGKSEVHGEVRILTLDVEPQRSRGGSVHEYGRAQRALTFGIGLLRNSEKGSKEWTSEVRSPSNAPSTEFGSPSLASAAPLQAGPGRMLEAPQEDGSSPRGLGRSPWLRGASRLSGSVGAAAGAAALLGAQALLAGSPNGAAAWPTGRGTMASAASGAAGMASRRAAGQSQEDGAQGQRTHSSGSIF